MTLQNSFEQGRNLTEEEEEKFNRLLYNGMYPEAKKYADDLRQEDVNIALINYSGREVVDRLISIAPEKAKELTKVFSDYYWPNWLL